MQVYVTRNITARMRRNDGTDNGNKSLLPGKYEANKTNDGALEILQSQGESLYLLPVSYTHLTLPTILRV